ncbi:MAG: hypothetical protein HY516_03435 [Candidatus Aenigmarchaeota archaeon]|nr:hypothetical protein [Candidatus Aenigmarchaeota archaeon]
MRGISTEKVQGGKLLRVKVDFDGKIDRVQITGDFFAHPEDVIEKIESSLNGLDVGTDDHEMRVKIESVISKTGADMVGIDAAAIARNVINAVGGAKSL